MLKAYRLNQTTLNIKHTIMKNIFTFLIFLFTITSYAQALQFDKRFVQSEDQWVAFPADSTGTYALGFIYIDSQAGLTLDYAGTFTIDGTGKYISKSKELEGSMKYRLEANNVQVAFVPESKFAELGIEKTPDWLKYYKKDEGSLNRLYNWGYRYNGWGECKKALEFLEKAYGIDPEYDGVRVEMAYSYNCLKRYKDAITVLEKALKKKPTDDYLNKELIYAEAQSGQVEKAKKSCRNAFKVCKDTYHAENAFNVLQMYHFNKDVANFDKWLAEANEWFVKDGKFLAYIENMKKDLKK